MEDLTTFREPILEDTNGTPTSSTTVSPRGPMYPTKTRGCRLVTHHLPWLQEVSTSQAARPSPAPAPTNNHKNAGRSRAAESTATLADPSTISSSEAPRVPAWAREAVWYQVRANVTPLSLHPFDHSAFGHAFVRVPHLSPL
eukprot:1182274-Prorocentrum_minimum.AAC.2